MKERHVTEWHSSKQGTFGYSHIYMTSCRQISDFLPRQSDLRTSPPLCDVTLVCSRANFFWLASQTWRTDERWSEGRRQERRGSDVAHSQVVYTEAKAHEIKDDHPAVRNRALLVYFGPLWVPIETCYKAYASCQSEQPRALWDHWWNMDNGVQGGHKGKQAT